LWIQLARTATRPDDEEEPGTRRPTEKEKETGRGVFRLTARAVIKRMAARGVKIVAAKLSAKTSARTATVVIASEAYDQAAAFLENTLDSLNPYCEPDAYLTELDGEDYRTPPPQDYYPLQL
jgi:hypothetical protein